MAPAPIDPDSVGTGVAKLPSGRFAVITLVVAEPTTSCSAGPSPAPLTATTPSGAPY